MLLECLILRTGVTPVTLGNSKMKYHFMPIPGSKKDEPTTSVCEVSDEEHIKYLLKTKQYREYDPDISFKDLLERRKELAKVPKLTGLKIEKYHEMGYIVVDQRGKIKKFLDSVGWHDSSINLMPFKSEADAFQTLKEEIEFEVLEAAEEEQEEKTKASGIGPRGVGGPPPKGSAGHTSASATK